jgi:hypothetical protein
LHKRLTKATFHLDSKEPKEKHVICKFPLLTAAAEKIVYATRHFSLLNLIVGFDAYVDLLESLNGEHKDQVSPIGALKFILERHISNLDNWSITTKVFIILHRSLQNKRVNRKVIRDLKKNEHLLHPY